LPFPFSLYAEATLFVPFLILGSVIGIQQFKNQAHPEAVEYRSPSCTQGILEQVTGTRLPPLISLIANVSITAYHMLHHAIVFVPIVGVSIGMYLGKKVVFFSNNI